MMLFFSDAMPEVSAVRYYEVLAVLVALVFVAQAIVSIRANLRRAKGTPMRLVEPLEVRAADEFARRHELAEVAARVARIETEIRSGFAEVTKEIKDYADEARQGRVHIYARIQGVSDKVAQTGKELGERIARVEALEEAGNGRGQQGTQPAQRRAQAKG